MCPGSDSLRTNVPVILGRANCASTSDVLLAGLELLVLALRILTLLGAGFWKVRSLSFSFGKSRGLLVFGETKDMSV